MKSPDLHVPSTLALNERAKYESIWEFEEYRKHSPGLENVERFMRVMKPRRGSSIIDVGCGDGQAGLKFQREHGMHVSWLDITPEALHADVDRGRFIESALWDEEWTRSVEWDFAFCVDVMEHVPPEFTMLVVERIMSCCERAWFQISTMPDVMGGLIGQQLHLQVQPFTWWLERLSLVTLVWDARDLCSSGLFVCGRGRRKWEM